MNKHNQRGFRAAATLLFVAVFMVAALHAQSPAGPARLAIRSGIVEVQRGIAWLPIGMGEPLNPGERVRTGTGSLAAVDMGTGKVVTLNEQSTVAIGRMSSGPAVQLEAGSMKVFSPSDIEIAAKDAIFVSVDQQPLDMELGFLGDKLNVTVFNGAVRSGSMVIRGGNTDPNTRTYTANSASQWNQMAVPNPTFYVYPYFMYGNRGNRGANSGAIVPPTVNNPTNPGYRPTQIVPPMSDPIRVPVTKP
jgi:hypothetical protein